MKTEGEAQLLRIFVGESDRWEGRPLYEAIVRAAREHGLAGATALRGIESFGASSRIHTVKILRLSEDLPIVVEIVDRPERIEAFLPTIDKMVSEGMVTLEKVRVFIYRHDGAAAPADEDELQLETPEHAPRAEAPTQHSAESAGGPVFAETTDHARQIIETARQSAAGSRRVFVDSVDVLLAMLCEPKGIAGQALTALGIDCQAVEQALREAVNRDETSAAFLTALKQRSLAEARWLGHDYAGTEHLLLALCEIRPNAATDILMRLGAQPRDICKEILTLLGDEEDWQGWLADHPDM